MKPTIRPPTWPPIEMPGIENVRSRFRRIVAPRPVSITLMPRARNTATATPIRPNTAPDAPTVKAFGLHEHHAEAAAEQGDEVRQHEADAPERRFEELSEPVEHEHVEADVDEVGVEEPGRHEPVPLAVGDADQLCA